MLLVVCKLAKIWFIMQCTLSQTKCSFYFFLKNRRFFSYDLFSSETRVCFLQYRSYSSWYFLLCSFVSFHLLTEPERSVWPLLWSCSCSWVSHGAVWWERMSKPRAWFVTQVIVGTGIIRKPRNYRRTIGCLLTASGLTCVRSWAVGLEMAK